MNLVAAYMSPLISARKSEPVGRKSVGIRASVVLYQTADFIESQS